jgi:hypothetical protein
MRSETPRVVSETDVHGETTVTVSIGGNFAYRGQYVLIGREHYRIVRVIGTNTLTVRCAPRGWFETVRRTWENWVAFPLFDASLRLRTAWGDWLRRQ